MAVEKGNTLKPYLNSVRASLTTALCIRNFPCQQASKAPLNVYNAAPVGMMHAWGDLLAVSPALHFLLYRWSDITSQR